MIECSWNIVPKKFQDDRQIVLAAVQQNGNALAWASKKLHNDREIVLAAAQQTGRAISYRKM